MRIITWNLRRANSRSGVWEILKELNPDILLLQEVMEIPSDIKSSFNIDFRYAINKNGKPQRFGTVILVKGEIISNIKLSSEFEWVNQELEYFKGNIIGCTVQVTNKDPINVVSVYSPAWPVSEERLLNIDVSQVKLQLNKKLWCTEILWSALKLKALINDYNWVVGGDFNSSETFDFLWKGGPRGNMEIIKRMNDLGLTECLRGFQKKITPTFKNAKGGKSIHQIDHLYITDTLYTSLSNCVTGNAEIIYGQSLSDHLPIIADFE